jgi:hypothetical protein
MKSILFSVFLLLFAFATLHAQTAGSTTQLPATDSTGSAQKTDSIKPVDLVDYLVKWLKVKNSEKKRDNRKIRFTLFPTTSSSGKTSFTSFNASFRLGADAKNTNVSTVYFYPYIGFGGQYGFDVQSFVWFPQNSWNFIGEYFIHNYPQDTWGLGGNSPDEHETLIDYQQLRIHQKSLKEIWPHFFAGAGYSLDQHINIQVEEGEMNEEFSGYFPDNNSISSGIVLPLKYDSRHNSVNPKQGFMADLTYSFFTPVLGSDEKWQSLFLDVRKYFPILTRNPGILAVRSYYWTVISGKAPFLDLPAVRWEPTPGQSSRGIQQNRYRSNALLDFESEYRFGITDNGFWGGVVFASITSASEYDTQHFMYWHPAGGVGVRMKFNKYSDANIGFDVAVSKGFVNVYLFIGEAF